MKNFTLVAFLFMGLVAVVLSTDIASFLSNLQSTTSSSGSTTGGRMVRESHDDKDNEKDDEKDEDKHTTSDRDHENGESGGSKALRILRQHRIPSSSPSNSRKNENSETTTTRKPRRERAAVAASKNQFARQTQQPESDPETGAPDPPQDPPTTNLAFSKPIGTPQQFTARQAPQQPLPAAFPAPAEHPTLADHPAHSHPFPPTGPATLTLPDGADVIVGNIKSGFTCASKIYGYYADIYNDCKLFHVCVPVGDENGVTNPIQWSFVCGNQTLFNQEKLTCDYQENVDCSKSENFYNINENFGRPEDKVRQPAHAVG